MTLLESMQIALRRAGLNTTATNYQDRAREYLNATLSDIETRVQQGWWWQFKEAAFTTATYDLDNFAAGASTGDTTIILTTGAGGVLDGLAEDELVGGMLKADGGTGAGYEYLVTSHTNELLDAVDVTIQPGLIAAIDTTTDFTWTRPYYDLVSGCHTPVRFRDVTNNTVLQFVGSDLVDLDDVDQTDTGTPEWVYQAGVSGENGRYRIGIHPHPDDEYVIRYRYFGYTPDFTSANDSSDLTSDLDVPQAIVPALFFGAASLLLSEEGDDESAALNAAERERVISRCMKANLSMQGERSIRMRRPNPVSSDFDFRIKGASLS